MSEKKKETQTAQLSWTKTSESKSGIILLTTQPSKK
jgi:hypothetical protein